MRLWSGVLPAVADGSLTAKILPLSTKIFSNSALKQNDTEERRAGVMKRERACFVVV